ncbi:UDP-glucose 4-epimerase GalE [Halioglobus japonicus]|uniref:UDP-glucose 4-epimerase n=1 Tax=Halioglobus japonicus TaxID=930805 RepID=A0AAP8MBP1_9GAMM|nr:UDP-glucose 4-epimerase GalE [Halioglobus japonicus]AQA16885.1 UDP-glucose 4-epimerase GalE [Halioglobus japonicus]PLW84771.1 UDP-glucose 4-epimerase GalE [Halioglobus japonicus]GHD21335.1 UDP-glucose 4-epimerase [Halioglobus japonicus]
MSQTVLVTGGAGYIGSHACVSLVEAGFTVVVLDNLCNSSREAVARVEQITGADIPAIEGDIRDAQCLADVFASHRIDAVMHFAGLKAVGESVEKPLEYYDNNVNGTLVLLGAMEQAGVTRMIFSSSATVYGDPASMPIREDFPTSATNPYGRSKLMVEEILGDWAVARPNWSIGRLRYFNPVGAHASGRIGEDPSGIPNNLMPFVAQVAVGRREKLAVFGDDYPTPDGTGVRDYIHVVDLAEGHVAALNYVLEKPGLLTVNLGTGNGSSVLDMVRAFEAASGKPVPYEIVARRAGDIAECWADPALAEELLGWKASRTLEDMCADTWRWQSANPAGYSG